MVGRGGQLRAVLATAMLVGVSVFGAPDMAVGAQPLASDSTARPDGSAPAASSVSAAADCSTSLQVLIDAAAPGAVVKVPPCIYRETVEIHKPITLDGQGRAEIRGSDDWSSGWTRSGSYWVRGTLPSFSQGNWQCLPSSNGRCNWREQVFVDGKPLVQVAANPRSGEFAVDSQRRVILADDPTGHLVEVTTREHWVVGAAPNVTIQGFIMKHAASRAQDGALRNSSFANWTVQNNVLSDAHGAVVSLKGAEGLKLLNNDISRGGQEGFHSNAAAGILIRGNRIHDNNTEEFEPRWEAGGLKITEIVNGVIEGNEVFNNKGPGIWCDIDCTGTVISNNRVHHNFKQGIVYEISHYGRIFGNIVWENGWGSTTWGWGAGILSQNADHTEIFGNIVAWNGDGISVISQNRASSKPVIENYVHHNAIFSADDESTALGWFEDWNGPLYAPESNNRGEANAYWFPRPETNAKRFEWGDGIKQLASFNLSPGDEGARYLSDDEKNELLARTGVPVAPERR